MSKKRRVAILGGSGYTALELIKILVRHPHVQIVCVTSRRHEGRCVSEVHPSLRGRVKLAIQSGQASEIADCDCIFSCLPHGASASAVLPSIERGQKVIDFSADFRFHSAKQFQSIYQVDHPSPEHCRHAVYGLPELFSAEIATAKLVANPGCFPTAALLGLAPLLAQQLIEPADIIIDAKTGVSGGGREPKQAFHFPECNESVAAYAVGSHRHQPEIMDVLHRLLHRSRPENAAPQCMFTPHLIPMDRGILATMYCRLNGQHSTVSLLESLMARYADCSFVRVTEALPTTKDVAHTNYCDLTVRVVGERCIVISAIDNLIKGASGTAVQNFNLMFDLPPEAGLL